MTQLGHLQISLLIRMVFAFLSLKISARCPDRSPKSPSRFQIYEPENGQCPRESTLLVHPEFCCAGDGARDPAHAELRLTLLRTVQLLARPTRAHSNSLSPCAAVSYIEAQGGEATTR